MTLAFISLLFSLIPLCLATVNNVVVFGDSYSDVGNKKLSSNGPLWSQNLAVGWNASLYSFAFSGATCDLSVYHDSNSISPEAPPSIVDQIEMYYQETLNLDPNSTVYAFWVGYTDVYNMLQTNNNDYGRLADCIIQQMRNVRKVFKTNRFLMFTLAPMEKMPYFAEDKIAMQRHKQAVDTFNKLLHEKVVNLVKHHESLELDLVDVHDLLKDMIDSPAEFGFKNGQDSFWDACQGQCNDSVDEYIWWDKTHLTGGAHRVIANSILISDSMEPSVALEPASNVNELVQAHSSRFQSPHYKPKHNTELIDRLVKEINAAKETKTAEKEDDESKPLEQAEDDNWIQPLYIAGLVTVAICIGFVLINKRSKRRNGSGGGGLAALSNLVRNRNDSGRGRFTPLRNMEPASNV